MVVLGVVLWLLVCRPKGCVREGVRPLRRRRGDRRITLSRKWTQEVTSFFVRQCNLFISFFGSETPAWSTTQYPISNTLHKKRRCQPNPTLSEAASRSRTSLLPTMHLHHPPPLIYTTTTMIPLSAPLMCTYHLHSPRRYTSFNSQSNHRSSTVSINSTTCLMRLNSDLTTACSN